MKKIDDMTVLENSIKFNTSFLSEMKVKKNGIVYRLYTEASTEITFSYLKSSDDEIFNILYDEYDRVIGYVDLDIKKVRKIKKIDAFGYERTLYGANI